MVGRFADAEIQLLNGRELLPDDRFLIHNLAEAYRKQGKREEALKLYSGLKPLSLEDHENLAVLYAELDSLDAALFHYGEVLKIDSGRHQAIYSIAGIDLIKGNLFRAVRGYEAYLVSPDPDPTLVRRSRMRLRQAYAAQGLEHLQSGDFSGAVVILEKRLGLGEIGASDEHTLAMAYGRSGEFRKAELAVRRALNLDAGMAIARLTLANALFEQRDLEAAVYYKLFLKDWDGDPRLTRLARSRLSTEK